MSLDIVHPSDARPASGSPRPLMLSCLLILFINQMRGRPLCLLGHYSSLMYLDSVHPPDARPASGSPRPLMLSCLLILFIHQMRGRPLGLLYLLILFIHQMRGRPVSYAISALSCLLTVFIHQMRGRPLGLLGHQCSLMSLDIVHPSYARPASGSPRPLMLSHVS